MNKSELLKKRKEVLEFISTVEITYDINIDNLIFDGKNVKIMGNIFSLKALDMLIKNGFFMLRGSLVYEIK